MNERYVAPALGESVEGHPLVLQPRRGSALSRVRHRGIDGRLKALDVWSPVDDRIRVIPRRILRLVLGSRRNPLDRATRQRTRLAAALAWAGLGANGLSAACYGPEKAFLALGEHAELGPLLALIMVVSVAVLALAYSQMFELFPNGGGSYRVASQLLGPQFGLVSGAALLIDYVLAIGVSLASGTDAMFSLLSFSTQAHKLPVAGAMGAVEALSRLTFVRDAAMTQLEGFCAKCGLAATRVVGFGTDPVKELERLLKQTVASVPDCVCFANKLILPPGRRLSEWLHNRTALQLQRRLHAEGIPL